MPKAGTKVKDRCHGRNAGADRRGEEEGSEKTPPPNLREAKGKSQGKGAITIKAKEGGNDTPGQRQD